MERKLVSLSIAVLLTSLCTSVCSAAQIKSSYGSTLHPIQSVVANMLHPPTDITVINASSNYIYAVVPNSPVNDYLSPGYNDHIYNYDSSVYSTYLVLQDPYRRTFYSNVVCRLAIVTVHGYTGNYTVNTDSDLCN